MKRRFTVLRIRDKLANRTECDSGFRDGASMSPKKIATFNSRLVIIGQLNAPTPTLFCKIVSDGC